ncbi:MAG: hypothetical protein JWM33_707, partial [Caulobacteraceae bacterium]|nr:hypothetical protein [Caulobacteraceae bacterium]
MRLFAAGSTLWLLRNELRLNLRSIGLAGRKGSTAAQSSSRRGMILMAVMLGVGCLICLPFAAVAHRFHARQTDDPIVLAALGLGLLAVFSLMLSQTLAKATDAFYERGDLDL